VRDRCGRSPSPARRDRPPGPTRRRKPEAVQLDSAVAEPAARAGRRGPRPGAEAALRRGLLASSAPRRAGSTSRMPTTQQARAAARIERGRRRSTDPETEVELTVNE
jgi:hypothetical protein